MTSQASTTNSLVTLADIAIGLEESSLLASNGTGYPVPAAIAQDQAKDRSAYIKEVENEMSSDYALMGLIRQRLTALDPNGSASDPTWQAVDVACREYGK